MPVTVSSGRGVLAASVRRPSSQEKNDVMKKVFRSVLTAVLFTLAGFTVAFAARVPDRIMAVVGNEIILASQVDEQALMYRLQNPGMQDTGLRKRIMENMINQKVLLTKARIDSVSVDEKSIDDMAAARYNTLRAGFPSVSALESRFSLPVNRLKKDIRDEIRNQSMIEAFRRKHFRDVAVSYEETMDFYNKEKSSLPEAPETVSFSQIVKLPEVSDAARQAALAKISAAREALLKGADFATTARKYSDDPGSRDQGGDLGFVYKGEFVASFEKAAYAMKPGQLSDIVESRFGYHLIQLIDREDNGIHARHILAMFDRSKIDTQKTLREMQDIRSLILSGKATFAQMAEKHSDDPQAAKSGGLVRSSTTGETNIERGSLKPELQKAIAGLKNPGDISQPEVIQPETGDPVFILVRLNSRTPAHVLSLENDFVKLEELALNRKRQELFNAWIESLKKEVSVQVMSDI